MNIILFEKDFFNKEKDEEEEFPDSGEALLPSSDDRTEHIRKILKLEAGEVCTAGLIDGPVGEVVVEGYERRGIRLLWRRTGPPVGLYPLTLLVGYTRPISAKRILREAASLGVERLVFTGTDTGEKSYQKANLWKEETRWRRFLTDGLQQAGGTVVPRVDHTAGVKEALRLFEEEDIIPSHCSYDLSTSKTVQFLLDNVTGKRALSSMDFGQWYGKGESAAEGGKERKVILAVGSERGWSERERSYFIDEGFLTAALGSRVLRSETACSAATAVALSRMGFM